VNVQINEGGCDGLCIWHAELGGEELVETIHLKIKSEA
jgi:hypothetical protein